MKLAIATVVFLMLRNKATATDGPITLGLSDLLDMPELDIKDDRPSLAIPKKVLGDNELYLCSDAQDGDICQINRVDLLPNPPQRGREFLINAEGELYDVIVKGSFVHVQVKLEGSKIHDKKYDLCAGLEKFGQACPFAMGNISISKEMKVDKMIPRGKYYAHIRAASAEDEQITCLTSFFEF